MRSLLLSLIMCSCIGCTSPLAKNDGFTLYLVRHAEKQTDGSRDPTLTRAGIQRAEMLSEWLQDKSIRDIWSSNFHRTRDTAKPLLSQGLQLTIYDPYQLSELSQKLLSQQNNSLVVGHSNTTADLARLLCSCEIKDMDDAEYDRLIVISVVDGKTEVTALDQKQLFKSIPGQ